MRLHKLTALPQVGISPQFVLYDLYGRVVETVFLQDFETVLPLAQLPAGMYVWQLRWRGVPAQCGRVLKGR